MSSLYFWFVYFKVDDVYKVKALFKVVLDRITGQHIYTLDLSLLKFLDYDTCYFKRKLYFLLTKEIHTEKSCLSKKVYFWYLTNACPTAQFFDLIWASQFRFRVVIITIGTLGFDHRFFFLSFVLLPKCVMQLYKSVSLFLCLLIKF